MIKNVLIAVIASLLSFAAGVVGIYVAIPTFAPERVEEARARMDSLAAAVHADSLRPVPTPEYRGEETPPLPEPEGDPIQQQASAPAHEDGRLAVLQDSVAALLGRLKQSEQEKGRLLAQVEDLRRRQQAEAAQRAQASELGSTLARLEDNELRALIQRLDLQTLKLLYQESSGRNRTRLLQAMASDRAARFVEDIVQSDAGRAFQAAPPAADAPPLGPNE